MSERIGEADPLIDILIFRRFSRGTRGVSPPRTSRHPVPTPVTTIAITYPTPPSPEHP